MLKDTRHVTSNPKLSNGNGDTVLNVSVIFLIFLMYSSMKYIFPLFSTIRGVIAVERAD
jgi:hypothetical protein